jgi:phage tail-like protein
MTTTRKILRSHWVVAGVAAVMFIFAGGRLMSVAMHSDLRPYSFDVTIEGRVLGAFLEVSGLDSEIEVIEFRDGSGGTVQKIPGNTKWGNIVLKRGFNGDTRLHDWFTEFNESRTERVNGTITMLDQTHTEVARWNFTSGWPSKVSGPTLNPSSKDVPTESIEIVHQGFSRVTSAR